MAVQVIIEFTDAQWELIKEQVQLPNKLGRDLAIKTPEELSIRLNDLVRHQVTSKIRDSEVKKLDYTASFDV